MLKGEIRKGTIRTTENQEKKYVKQFKGDDYQKCIIAINNMLHTKIYASYHLKRKSTVSYSMKTICDMLKHGEFDIIEYNRTRNNGRVLIESWSTFPVDIDGKITECVMKVVVEPKTAQIVTVYYNSVDDIHATLNMKRYNKDLEVVF
ncbi:MAG: hypothetical protein ACLS90_00390 [Clostridia bacterium]